MVICWIYGDRYQSLLSSMRSLCGHVILCRSTIVNSVNLKEVSLDTSVKD